MQKVLDSRKHTDPTSEPAHDGDVHSLSHPPTETLSVSLLRHYQQGFEQVGKDIPNDAVVEVRLGTSQELFARGHTFTVGALTSKNKVKGTDVPLPPVHFLERKDYIDLCMALGDDLMQAIQTGAHFDESIGVVEVPVKIPEVTDTFPSTVTMSGREYKQLLASLEHEFRHAAGEGELLAYYHGDRAAVALGLKETARTPFEIMLMLEETDFYDAS
ncbi:MAG: hypothetical protein KDD55_02485, partial [Bdellovibrionales bacterium]|nr:hypothetical protein [Bdellovibrionales bacterium]